MRSTWTDYFSRINNPFIKLIDLLLMVPRPAKNSETAEWWH